MLEGDTDIGDRVLDEAVAESVTLLLGFCSENLLEEKKLGLEFLKHGELGGTGGLGSLAGLYAWKEARLDGVMGDLGGTGDEEDEHVER